MKLTLLLFFLVQTAAVFAEIIADTTLNSNVKLQDSQYEIRGGQQRGENLFHSFEKFSLNAGETATFLRDPANLPREPAKINYAISRVTGHENSLLDGTLKTDIPHFYFFNPNGILIGKNAQLNVPNSVHLSSAHYLKLEETGRFDAINPEKSILTSAPPCAFGFLDKPAPIQIQGATLPTKPTKGDLKEVNSEGVDLEVVGGDLTLENSGVHLSSGNISLLSIASAGEISANSPHEHSPSLQFGKMEILDSGLQANTNSDDKDAGTIYIRAGQLYIEDTHINSNTSAEGAAGKIHIEADNFTMEGKKANSEITANNSGLHAKGAGGDIEIVVHHSFQMLDEVEGETTVIRTVAEGAPAGEPSKISIQANELRLSGDATIDTSTYEKEGQREGGKVQINARTLLMEDAAWILSSSFSQGDSGLISIKADELVLNDDSAISGATFRGGNGGNIDLRGTQISLTDNAVVTVGTEGPGKGGNISLEAQHIELTDKASISSMSQGQDIFVNTAKETFGQVVGNENLKNVFENSIKEGKESESTPFLGGGQSGTIDICTDSLTLTGGSITVFNRSTETAGDINLTLNGNLRVNGGKIITDAKINDGGNINIGMNKGLLNVAHGAITASAQGGEGDGGSVKIGANKNIPKFAVLNQSQVTANAVGGNGGQIVIRAENLVKSANSQVSAATKSKTHVDGTVEIDAERELTSDPAVLSKDLLSGRMELKNCPPKSVKTEEKELSLTILRPSGVSPLTRDLF